MSNTTGFRSDRDGIYIDKSPAAVLPYTLDYTAWISTDTIVTATWTVSTIAGDSSALAIDSDSETTLKASVVLSGGSIGSIYTVSNTIVTAGGKTEKRSFRVVVEDRSV